MSFNQLSSKWTDYKLFFANGETGRYLALSLDSARVYGAKRAGELFTELERVEEAKERGIDE